MDAPCFFGLRWCGQASNLMLITYSSQCEPDMDNIHGPCLVCRNASALVVSQLPCLRWIITDSSLYREQNMPYQMFSQRWKSMDLVDIQDWVSSETKTIVLSQIYLDAPYTV